MTKISKNKKRIRNKKNLFMKNWCTECAMDDADRKKNKLKKYKCPRCGKYTDEI